jgi:hypothetical protein
VLSHGSDVRRQQLEATMLTIESMHHWRHFSACASMILIILTSSGPIDNRILRAQSIHQSSRHAA